MQDAEGNTWYIGSCTECGQVAHGPWAAVESTVAIHFEQTHPEHHRALRHGQDFTIAEGQLRCDTCSNNVELPYWWHISDPPTHRPVMQDTDGRWLLCDTCHQCLSDRHLVNWVRHSWSIQTRNSPFLADVMEASEMRAGLAQHLRNLMSNLDAGVRYTVAGPIR